MGILEIFSYQRKQKLSVARQPYIYLCLLFLLLVMSCAGGGYTYSTPNNYAPRPAYNYGTGQTEWVNPTCCPSADRPAPLMNYETGKMYVPLVGSGNMYMDSQGNVIQPY